MAPIPSTLKHKEHLDGLNYQNGGEAAVVDGGGDNSNCYIDDKAIFTEEEM